MASVIAICQSGGEFETSSDGVMTYKGGEAHAIDVDSKTKWREFKSEVAEMFSYNLNAMSLKYFLPGNKKTLITIATDKDFKRMISFHKTAATVDVYAVVDEAAAADASQTPASRLSKAVLPETAPLVDIPMADVENAMNGSTEPSIQVVDTLHGVDDTNNLDVQIDLPDIPRDMNLDTLDKGTLEAFNKNALQWQNAITGVGQRFIGIHEFRESLRKYATAHQFAYRYYKNDSNRVSVKCKVEGCPWRIFASRLVTTELVMIKKMIPTHTCDKTTHLTEHQSTRRWVANIIKEKLKAFPDYKPKDIVSDIKEEYGIQLNYVQAYRGKEIAKEQLQGSHKEAYKLLPIFCEKIMESNPGSLATFTTKEDSSFHRVFVSFRASLSGFLQGCRPLLFLDSIPLNAKYQGTLLAATAADADDGVFPVAFSVVDAETDENWHWFLLQLKTALSTPCPLTFVADRQKGLRDSIAEIFNDSYHACCLRYLTEQLIKDLKGQFSLEVKQLMVQDLYAAAYSPTPEGFQKIIESIKGVSLEAYNWIIQSEPQNWANAFFQGARYNHMSSNFGELFYSWVSDAHELPITQMVEVIRGKIAEMFETRRANSSQWVSRLAPSMEEKLKEETMKVRTLQVLLTTGNIFEVRGETIEMIDMDRWDCSCKGWQLTGLPCCHAIAVITCLGQSPYDYCSRYFTTESYRLTYAENIHPIPTIQKPSKRSTSHMMMVTPPRTRRPPGRPTTKKVGELEVSKRQSQCSRCKGIGHKKSTCKEVL